MRTTKDNHEPKVNHEHDVTTRIQTDVEGLRAE
jgi:hypothetical protein